MTAPNELAQRRIQIALLVVFLGVIAPWREAALAQSGAAQPATANAAALQQLLSELPTPRSDAAERARVELRGHRVGGKRTGHTRRSQGHWGGRRVRDRRRDGFIGQGNTRRRQQNERRRRNKESIFLTHDVGNSRPCAVD